MSYGPQGKTFNLDSYLTTTPPTLPPAPPKQINAGDTKLGPPKPGATRGAAINLDTFHE